MMDRDLMFLRNVVHGAPVSTTRLAVRLRAIDTKLKSEARHGDKWAIKDFDYYVGVAETITERRA